MERDVWRIVAAALKRLPRRCSRGQQYSNAAILGVLLWAAVHDRSILWACRRASWPMQAWRRCLPNQSTMSRRLRDPEILADLATLLAIVQASFDDHDDTVLRVDGKPLAVNAFSADRDAARGWGVGAAQRGYKLHALVANARRLVAHRVEPMNTPEAEVAQDLLRHTRRVGAGTLVLADASYDTNAMHAAARVRGAQLLAPRRRPGTLLSKNLDQDAGRIRSLLLMEGDPAFARWQRARRSAVEHYFAGLTAAGLHALPPWIRTLPRVRVWVAAKLTLNAARIAVFTTTVA